MSRNRYVLPVRMSDVLPPERNISLGFNSHEGALQYALDFLVPERSGIFAAQSGKVVYVKQDSNIGGPDRKYWSDGNRVVIRHENGEYSAYEHLRYGGIAVYVGQQVRQGEFIAFSGNTGCSSCPHLHFEVFRNPSNDETEGVTIEIDFIDGYNFDYNQNVTASSFSHF